jgi:photosystem II stability/assembly factor-like uncharacterized protein
MNRRSMVGVAALVLIMTAGLSGAAPLRADSVAARITHGTIYAGVAGGHLYRSAAGTSTWDESDAGLPADAAITALAFTADGAMLYAATWGSGLYVSTDNGMDWRATGGPNPDQSLHYISGLALNPTHRQTIYAVTSDDRFHLSTDGGDHWDSTPLPVDLIDSVTTTSLAVSRQDSAVMLVGIELEGIVRTADGGRTWSDTTLSTNVSINALAFSPRSATTAYAATDKGIYRTMDGGKSWQSLRHGIQPGTQFQSVAVDPGNPRFVLSGTTAGRFYRSSDGGTTWSAQGKAGGNQINTILFDPARPGLLFAGTNDGDIIYRSDDNGRHWSGQVTGFDPGDEILSLAASAD